MFGLGMPEIFLILAIALIVIGPKKLPDLAKTLGKAMGEFKSAAQDFKRSIDLESSTVTKVNDPPVTLKASIKDAVASAKAEEQGTLRSPVESPENSAGTGPESAKDSKDTAAQ